MKRISICVPNIEEQNRIVAKFEAMRIAIDAHHANLDTLRQQKLGLMQDLLTGKVPVNVDAAIAETADA